MISLFFLTKWYWGLTQTHLVGRIVILLVIGLPVVSINVLLPFSRFPQDEPTEAREKDGEETEDEEGNQGNENNNGR